MLHANITALYAVTRSACILHTLIGLGAIQRVIIAEIYPDFFSFSFLFFFEVLLAYH